MTRIHIVVVLTASLLGGCGASKQCEEFAHHLAEVLTREAAEPPAPEHREKMVAKTIEACAADPPSKKAMECAMAAKTSEAIKACEAAPEG